MSKHKPNQIDNYEVEIVEDIPEQFDLSRYKKSNMVQISQQYKMPQQSSPTQPFLNKTANQQSYNQANIASNNIAQSQQTFYYTTNIDHNSILDNAFFGNQQNKDYLIDQKNLKKNAVSQAVTNSPENPDTSTVTAYGVKSSNLQELKAHQFVKYAINNQGNNLNQNYRLPSHQLVLMNSANQLVQQNHVTSVQCNTQNFSYLNQSVLDKASSTLPLANNLSSHIQLNYYAAKDFNNQNQKSYPNTLKKKNSSSSGDKYVNEIKTELEQPVIDHEYSQAILQESSTTNWNSKKIDGRKKYSFDDENDNNLNQKREYFLKGSDNINDIKSENYNQAKIDESPICISTDNQLQIKSNLKATKKQGVTFDEKLEVYEIKNPHYGLDIKSEKREIRKKKKDRQKEEELILKTKFDMKLKIQNQNMLHYYFYEKTLVYNALMYYEENFYRPSIIKLQDKLRNNKPDEKLRDQLLQTIEKDNQTTIDIFKLVKKEFLARLEPYCNQFQTTVDKLHSYPGMYQIMQTTANSINYIEMINYFINKEANSPLTLRKILGHEGKSDKLSNIYLSYSLPSIQRNCELWIPKQVMAAIDSHVKEVCFANYKTITEFIFKLYEICDNDLHIVRAIYKYVLITQLDAFRRNETGSLIMRNFDLGIESTNTIFARLCSFTGIENRFLRGLWKTICQEPGEKCEAKCIWNVVNLESGWRFIQPAFTPIKFYSRPDISYEETEFYFLSDPDALSHEFFPSEKSWHFNDSINNVKDFEKRPIITPYFRILNLSILHLSNQTGNLEKEPFKLILRYPSEYADSINFKFSVKPINSFANNCKSTNLMFGNEPNCFEQNLNLFVISSLISDENAILFKISALPELGNYSFTVYASLFDDILNGLNLNIPSCNDKTPPLFYTHSLNEDHRAIFSCKINCSKLSHFEIPPNRISEINTFGTNNFMKRLGLKCLDYKQGVLGTDREGRINLVFEMSQPLDIEAYLYSSDPSISSKYLELCMLKRIVDNYLILIINPPHAGLYGLDLHGAIKGTFNSLLHPQLPPIGKFLIKSHHQVRSFYQYPKGDNREWGPKQGFYDLGLHTIGNMDPYIVNEDGKQLEIEIAMLKSVTMWYKFDYDQNGIPKAIDNFCFMNYKNSNKKEKSVSFLLRFPYRGFYHLAVMATDNVFPSKPDEIVYNYLIRVQDPSNDVQSFPIILNPILWKDCCLITPKDFRLSSTDVHFSVIVPKTNQVQITNGDRVLEQLEPKEIENSWVGLVSLCESRSFYIEAEYENKFKKMVRFKGLHSLKE